MPSLQRLPLSDICITTPSAGKNIVAIHGFGLEKRITIYFTRMTRVRDPYERPLAILLFRRRFIDTNFELDLWPLKQGD